MTGSTSFIARILILSGPDDLLDGMDFTILCISAQETGKKLRVTNEQGGRRIRSGLVCHNDCV